MYLWKKVLNYQSKLDTIFTQQLFSNPIQAQVHRCILRKGGLFIKSQLHSRFRTLFNYDLGLKKNIQGILDNRQTLTSYCITIQLNFGYIKLREEQNGGFEVTALSQRGFKRKLYNCLIYSIILSD